MIVRLPQECPNCGSDQVIFSDLTHEACACIACGQLFVPEDRVDPDGQLCNDCAFRPNSAERQDPWKWADIIETTIVDQVHPFHCHKGMACELKGATLHYVQPAGGLAAMQPCAGWRAHLKAYQAGTPARKL
jgi:hypothetical protein